MVAVGLCLAITLGVAGAIIAVQGGSSASGETADPSLSSEPGNPDSRERQVNPFAGPVKKASPARMVNAASADFSPSAIWPVKNGWVANDHVSYTGVWAGASGTDRNTGRFVILRQDYVHVTQHIDSVDVTGAGPLTITRAPLGRGAETSSQRDGELEFTGANGVTGTLHLADDTVSLNP